jgi:1-acyl-sn-glycerol-3-phosphate acyltransferase
MDKERRADLPRKAARGSALLDECRASWDAWEQFSSSRHGAAAMFGWAFAEATVWPIIPDFLLVPLAAGSRARMYIPLLASIFGSALGGVALYTFSLQFPEQALALLAHLPLVGERQVDEARRQLVATGAAAFFGQPWSGVPFKVWAIEAGAQGLNPFVAVPIFVVARALRMTIFAVVSGVLAARVLGFFRDFSLYVGVVYAILFLYAWWQVIS